jgi:hypothetical protein
MLQFVGFSIIRASLDIERLELEAVDHLILKVDILLPV